MKYKLHLTTVFVMKTTLDYNFCLKNYTRRYCFYDKLDLTACLYRKQYFTAAFPPKTILDDYFSIENYA